MNEILKTLLTISLTASVMILIVMGVRAVLSKRMNPVVIMMLWAVVLIRLCIPFTLESPLHIGDLFPLSSGAEQVNDEVAAKVDTPRINIPVYGEEVPVTVNDITPPNTDVAVQLSINTTQPTVWQRIAVFGEGISIWSILAVVWVLGVLGVLAKTIWQGVRLKKKLRHCKRVPSSITQHFISELQRELSIKKDVEVVECENISTPAVFGYFHPVIMLPAQYLKKMGKSGLCCVLLHEMCHIKRHDILKCYVWLIVNALHWFNPFVWLAFKLAKDDMELCCDDKVMKTKLDYKYEYTQSLVNVLRIAKRKTTLPVTVSLYEKRSKLKERVMRMLKPNKRSKAAVVISAVLAIIMAVTCFTTACQSVDKKDGSEVYMMAEKPDEETVDVKTPEEKVEQSEEPLGEQEKPIIEYSVVNHWADSFEGEDSRLWIDVDADVLMPNAQTYPVYEVNPYGKFSQQFADRMVKAFFGDAEVYQTAKLTKRQLDTYFYIALEDYHNMQLGIYDFPDDWDDAAKQEQMEKAKTYVDNIREQRDNALDEAEFVPVDTTLDYDEYGIAVINAVADMGYENKAELQLVSSDSDSYITFSNQGGYNVRYSDGIERKAPIGDLTISEDEAIKRADDFLADLGLNDYICMSSSVVGRVNPNTELIDEDRYAYSLVYTRNLNGTPLASSVGGVFETCRYCTETIRITVNHDGIRDFEWSNKYDLRDMVQQNSVLMPFEDITALIPQKIFTIYKDTPDSLSNEIGSGDGWWKTKSYTLFVDTIRLEYAKMPAEGEHDILIVPVWNVYASSEWLFWKNENGEKVEDVVEDNASRVILTINAIDGSVWES